MLMHERTCGIPKLLFLLYQTSVSIDTLNESVPVTLIIGSMRVNISTQDADILFLLLWKCLIFTIV